MAKIGVFKPFRGSYNALSNIILEDGEIAFETTNKRIYIGNGSDSIGSLTPFIGEDYSTSSHVIGFKNNIYVNLATDTFESDIKQGHTYSYIIDGTGLYGAYVWYFYKKTDYGGFAIVMSSEKDYCFSVAFNTNESISGARRLA